MDECVVTWQFDKTADDLNLVKGEENFSCEVVVKYPSLSLAAAYSMLMSNAHEKTNSLSFVM
jgi:hypothetical protein